jgi:acyl-CoA synthetase (AMP-forming)/AMP-acid ligase II
MRPDERRTARQHPRLDALLARAAGLLEGRIKEIIKSGGVTVIPTEIETLLIGHPSVSDAAVIGIPDEHWGEAAHAFVTLAPGVTVLESELKRYCQERLAGYKRPKIIHIVQELPRTGIGKIARQAVRAQAVASRADCNPTVLPYT